MPMKMMPVALHKSNWKGVRQMGKSETAEHMLRKPIDNKRQMRDFVSGRRG